MSDPEQFGTGIINFGKFTMHGAADDADVRARGRRTARRSYHVDLSEPVSGWQVGDRLVLPDTRHMKESETTGTGWINAQNQWEERTVQSDLR